MKYSASVTYEFPLAAPETVRLEIEAPSHGTAARRAFQALKKAHPRRRPSSIVLVLDMDPDAEGQADALEHAESGLTDA